MPETPEPNTSTWRAAASRAATVAAVADGCAAEPPVDAACTTLVALYADGGYLVPAQPSRGHALAVDACRRGARGACLFAADDLATGLGVVADTGAARAGYAALCDADVPTACFRLADLLDDDDRPADAARLFARACDDGLPAACTALGFAHYTARGAAWEVDRARALYQRGCELGDPWGCANLGELELLGVGAAPDAAAARAHFTAACTDEVAPGCAQLAALDEAAGADRAAVRERYLRACDGGDALGCAGAARATDDAATRARLAQRAYDLARASADDNPYAAFVLGGFSADGVGTVRDPQVAGRWFDRACAGRDPSGCLAAGDAHTAAGRGDHAVAAYDRACAAGVERACTLASSVLRRLPLGARGCACAASEPPSPAAAALVLATLVALVRPRPRRRRDATPVARPR